MRQVKRSPKNNTPLGGEREKAFVEELVERCTKKWSSYSKENPGTCLLFWVKLDSAGYSDHKHSAFYHTCCLWSKAIHVQDVDRFPLLVEIYKKHYE